MSLVRPSQPIGVPTWKGRDDSDSEDDDKRVGPKRHKDDKCLGSSSDSDSDDALAAKKAKYSDDAERDAKRAQREKRRRYFSKLLTPIKLTEREQLKCLQVEVSLLKGSVSHYRNYASNLEAKNRKLLRRIEKETRLPSLEDSGQSDEDKKDKKEKKKATK